MGVPPSNFLPVVCDVTKEVEVATLPKIVAKRWHGCGVDVLVNNAGMSRNDAGMFDGNVASWVEMLSTNVLGTAMCTRAVVQDMQLFVDHERPGGYNRHTVVLNAIQCDSDDHICCDEKLCGAAGRDLTGRFCFAAGCTLGVLGGTDVDR
eukprot:362713-Chlamydomonas_euryale.AAC.21